MSTTFLCSFNVLFCLSFFNKQNKLILFFFSFIKIDFLEKRPDYRVKEKIASDMKQVMQGEHHIHGYTGHVHASQVSIYIYVFIIYRYIFSIYRTCNINDVSGFSMCMGDHMVRLREICMKSQRYLKHPKHTWTTVTIVRLSIKLESFLYLDHGNSSSSIFLKGLMEFYPHKI